MPRYDYEDETETEIEFEPHRRRPQRPKQPAAESPRRPAEPTVLEPGFRPTYRAARHEAEWLYQSLATFFDQELITDIEAQVKGGKEATVYRCTAHPSVGLPWLAAKVYRPRRFRALRKDAIYKQGRPLLNSMGGEMKKTDKRMARAIDARTSTGLQAQHTSWLMYEFTTMEHLHEAGGAVPRPIAAAENAILMEYIGDDNGPAPTLSEARVDRSEAGEHFHVVMKNVELLLAEGLIHGDLSAYNLLYWEGAIHLIDFPQVVDAYRNPEARGIFERDVTRVCDYFARRGVTCDAGAIARGLWRTYIELPEADQMAEQSRLEMLATEAE